MTRYIVQFHGDFNTGAEQFQHSLALEDDGSSSVENQAEAMRDNLATSLTNSNFMSDVSGMYRYTHVTVAELLSQNPNKLSAAVRRDLATPVAGFSTQRTVPPQCAICVSLTAGTYANGTPVRGRFYLPPTAGGNSINTDGSLISTVKDKAGLFAAELIGGANTATSLRRACVWSRLNPLGTGKGDGDFHTITAIRVGSRYDVIRSRGKSIPEGYTEYTFSTT